MSRKALACLAFVTVVACSKDLSRGSAKDLIQKSSDFNTVTAVVAKSEAFDTAVKDNVLKPRHFTTLMAKDDGTGSGPYELDDLGKQVFTMVSLNEFKLREPLHRQLSDVTGITDGPQPGVTKAAQFKWHFTDLSEPVSKYTGVTNSDHDGEALFRKYDDGWRVEEVKYGDMSGGGNTLPLKAGSMKPLEMIAVFSGKLTGGSYPAADAYAEIFRATDEATGIFGVFLVGHNSAPVKISGYYDPRTTKIEFQLARKDGDAVRHVEGAITGNNMTGTLTENPTPGAAPSQIRTLEMTKQPLSGEPKKYYSVSQWEKDKLLSN